MSDQNDWQEFLKQVDKLTAAKQRAIAAVIGALVADAACMYVCVSVYAYMFLLKCIICKAQLGNSSYQENLRLFLQKQLQMHY